ncbi:MAG: alpha-galactosidase [Clostridia bacterium]|nr:alpha-galactosidase [Clostridia bacterium]
MAIVYQAETKTFFLDGAGVTYAFCINEAGYAEHLYWGTAIPHDDLRYTCARWQLWQITPPGQDETATYQSYAPELAFFGTGDYREPAVLPVNEAGDRLCELLYASHEILPAKPAMAGMPSMEGGETLVLHLLDSITGFAADLYYTVYDDCGVIARRVVYRNTGNTPVILRRAYSFSMEVPGQDYEVLTLYGNWAAERRIQRTPVHHGVVAVDSKLGMSSNVLNPFLAVVETGADELSGEAFGFSLVYSSSFVLKAQGTSFGNALVTGGIQDFDFSWTLDAGEELETPEIVMAYSDEGIGGMSRAFHRAFREHLINKRYVKASRPIVINNWEATYFDFDLPKLKAFVDTAQGTGIDTFVLDDGWFGKRDDDTSGLGDWVVNGQKLEGGLTPLIDYVHSKGMKFGLWFEPEMVNEDSDLFRAHPDYAIGVPGRQRCYGRHQYVLDLTRQEVRDCIVESVNAILHTHAIDYVKWDFNRPVAEFYSLGREAGRQAEFAHRFALGLYDLCRRIVEGNPDIIFEGCSGGGARFDPAMLAYFSQIWTSDDSDAEERTRIQYGTSLVYPLSAMSCHVSVCPNHQTGRTTPFATRGHIASLGATGYELDPTRLSVEELEQVRQQTAAYRETEALVLEGDLYRLDDPFTGNYFSFLTVSPDKTQAKLTAYRRLVEPLQEVKRIRLAGLAPDKTYTIPALGIRATGATLMRVGLIPVFGEGDFQSVQYMITAE